MTAEQLDLLADGSSHQDDAGRRRMEWARDAADIDRHERNAIAAREDAIQRADEHAAYDWKQVAYGIVKSLASEDDSFTADDVWDTLSCFHNQTSTHNPSALGPVFRRASKAGLIRKTGELRLSRNPRRHRDLTVWVGT